MNKRNTNSGLTRREALRTGGVVGVGALVAGGKTTRAAATVRVPRRKLGKTGKTIPILLVGGSMRFDQSFDPKLAEAVAHGANYIDTARVYAGGTSETAVGAYHTKAKNRASLWITSKSPAHDAAGFERKLGESLRALKTNYVDLYYMHAVRDKATLTADMAKMAEKLKKQGKIRYFGFSCHHGNVAELLHEAARHSWIDSVMFRYNFRQYGNKALNKAIDAAARANVGLIAMKTQGSEASFRNAWKKFKQAGKFTKHQAVLKAVWADKRITAAVSHMDTLGKLRENVAAAVNKSKLSQREGQALEQYAAETRRFACDGCDHICRPYVQSPVQIGATMRYLMYHDSYGQRQEARRLYSQLPENARPAAHMDFNGASAACPNGINIGAHMKRATKVLG